MTEKEKTVILLNLRFFDFHSPGFFQKITEEHNVRIVAVLDHQFYARAEKLPVRFDRIYRLPAWRKDGFLGEFRPTDLDRMMENELGQTPETVIYCSDEFNLLNAGRLRREYGLTGHTDHELLRFRNKHEMKHMLSAAGIRVPRFRHVDHFDTYHSIAGDIGPVFVLKPVDSCGSHGISIIYSAHEFESFRLPVPTGQFMAEEYIQGTLYHVDTLRGMGKTLFSCCNEYSCPNHEYLSGKTLASFPLTSDALPAQRLTDFSEKCLNVLDSNNMVNHMELFIDSHDEIIFLEVSARPPGALLGLTHSINYGINLMDEDFMIQTGLSVTLPEKQATEKQHAFYGLFPLLPGTVTALKKPDTSGKSDLQWFVTPGEKIGPTDCTSLVDRAATGIFYHDNPESLRNDFEIVKCHQAIEVA